MMRLTLTQAVTLLKEHDLLIKVVNPQVTEFTAVTYDSRHIPAGQPLFFCKGVGFKADYLAMAIDHGAVGYVATQAYEQPVTGIVVKDDQKAMALLAAAFYDYPQNDLFIVGITGTKGKTTTAYFTHNALTASAGPQTALLSTLNTILGPQPDQTFKSHLTTPESLDLFAYMRQAVDNKMTHLVMEVSSQAYLKHRVYGLTFDVGIFLNISPDHIGRNEHPTFANYLFCKEQLLVNARTCLINADMPYFAAVQQAAQTTTAPERIFTFGKTAPEVDFRYQSVLSDLAESKFQLRAKSPKAQALQVAGEYIASVPGDYNEGNATAAVITAGLAGAKAAAIQTALQKTHIPGRMEVLPTKGHGNVYVDYAHDYASVKRLVAFLRSQTPAGGKVIVVLGAPGDKGISRRPGFGKALSEERADEVILTTDDPGFEDPKAIADEIAAHIDPQKVGHVQYIADRAQAIATAITMSHNDMVVIAGKGADTYQKVKGQDLPYPNDLVVAKQVIEKLGAQPEK